MKDEIDLYADVKWLEIQYEFCEQRLKKLKKELKLFEELKIFRETELNMRNKKKVAEAKKILKG